MREAARLVLEGGLIAYPTDTVYALGCDPFDLDAVDRLVKAKERIKGSLPILVSSLGEAERIGEINEKSAALARKFWPGPLTLIVQTRSNLPGKVTDNSQSVGLRIPNHEATRRLILESGGAIVGTSANISGQRSLSTAQEVLEELGGRIDLVLDGGPTLLGRESTVVRILEYDITVLREGAISRDDILKALSVTRAY
ncbi:threonylcarbamoyl-AMP synthase [archaeon 13_1_40CM_2_52_13]|nr:MAG: threonylcarbamoyl-AMP synthase [archaeon 13_1_40CM_2_52_13]OLE91150.1 MAG: threonylcarbamoyl-AMP synthase [Crenarchaeota archaeon 13_1_20CM_2_51_8]